jgi:hypothetical protein
MPKVITREDYKATTGKESVTFSLVSPGENTLMTLPFISESDAISFKENAFDGYYSKCIISKNNND